MTSGLPTLSFQVAFSGTKGGVTVPASPNDPTITPNWSDLTHRLRKVSTKRGKSTELDQAQSVEMEFYLKNADGALDPNNTASPYYPYVLPLRQYRWQLTYASTTYTLSTGYIEGWPQTWELHGTLGWVQCKAVDSLAALSQIVLPSCLVAEVLLDNPIGYWPLGEPSGASQGANIAATTNTSAMLPTPIAGGGTVPAFGGTTFTGLLGAGATAGTTGPLQGDSTGLSSTNVPPNGFTYFKATIPPYTGNTVTIECWITGWNTSGQFPCNILELTTPGGSYLVQGGIQIGAGTNGTPTQVTGGAGQAGPTFAYVGGPNSGNGAMHHLVVTASAGTATLWVDGVNIGSSSYSGSFTGLTDINILGDNSAGYSRPMTLAHVAVYETALTGTRINAHYNAGVTGFPELSGARFTRLLGYAPWNGGSVVPAGDTGLLGLTDCATKSALAALLDVCTAEAGNMYADNLGRIVFENRHARMLQTSPAWTFGENTTGGELPYEDGVTIDFDPINVFNSLTAQRPGGAIYNFFDAASMLANFPRTWPTNPLVVPIDTDQNLYYYGQYIVAQYKNPVQRLEQVQFKPSSNPALYPFVSQVQIGQRIRFNRRPRDASSTISLDFFVESVAHDYDATTGEFVTTLECSPAIWTQFGLVTAARGTLNASTPAGVGSFVLNVTPTAGNTLAQDGWTKSAIPSIQIVDGANTETLGVLSITVSGSQATVNTLVNSTYPHAAGVVVAQTNVHGYSYNQFDAGAVLDGTQRVGY